MCEHMRVCVCACASVYVRMCKRVCVHECVYVRVCEYVCVLGLGSNCDDTCYCKNLGLFTIMIVDCLTI